MKPNLPPQLDTLMVAYLGHKPRFMPDETPNKPVPTPASTPTPSPAYRPTFVMRHGPIYAPNRPPSRVRVIGQVPSVPMFFIVEDIETGRQLSTHHNTLELEWVFDEHNQS